MRFLNQLGLLIWGIMILYAGYQYAWSVFTWKSTDGKNTIKNAIIWILVIIFSYAIWKWLESMFL
jgi:membrane protein DedA with SNARE-associated domain